MYYWRTRDGHEVDVLIEHNGRLLPIEIKSTATPTSVHLQSLKRLQQIVGDATVEKAVLICRVEKKTPMAHNSVALPWDQIEAYLRSCDIVI